MTIVHVMGGTRGKSERGSPGFTQRRFPHFSSLWLLVLHVEFIPAHTAVILSDIVHARHIVVNAKNFLHSCPISCRLKFVNVDLWAGSLKVHFVKTLQLFIAER